MRQGGEGRTLCALYVRLSREDEDRQQPESESIQNQKALLMDYAKEMGIGCDVIPAVTVDGRTVSSTYIRRLVEEGRQAEARRLLGHDRLRL